MERFDPLMSFPGARAFAETRIVRGRVRSAVDPALTV